MDRRPPSRLRMNFFWAVGLLLVLGILFLSTAPSVPRQTRPSAQDIQAARALWSQLKESSAADTATQFYVDDPMLRGLSTLISDASGLSHIRAGIQDSQLVGAVSVDLPLGLWLNSRATLSGRHDGFPPYQLTVGRVTFPAFMARWMAEAGRWGLGLMGATIPPLDELVQGIDVQKSRASLMMAVPRDSNMFDSLLSTRTQGLDQRLIAQIYCRTAADLTKRPVQTLSQLLNRSFSGSGSDDAARHNRATFVALSLIVVGEQAYRLVPDADALTRKCAVAAAPPITLQGRDDLAKHWTFSAALASALGQDVADNLGEWKELDDSLSGGSGFSFVDLSADRAGVRAALLSSASGTAKQMQQRMRRAQDEDLLPAMLLQAPEGLSENIFKSRFGDLQADQYRQSVAYIDQLLAAKTFTGPIDTATDDGL